MQPLILTTALHAALASPVARADAPAVDEAWPGRPPPVVGEGEGELTVVVRGAREAEPPVARLGEVEGRLEHLGLAVFAVTLRGVEGGELEVEGDGRAWRGEVGVGDPGLVLLEAKGAQLWRLPAAPEAPREAPARAPWGPLAWLALCGAAVAWAARGRAGEASPGGAGQGGRGRGGWLEHGAVLAFFIAVAAAWSWPAPLLDPQRLAVRHFDLWPALWLLDRAPAVGLDLVHPGSAWPEGEVLARLDSWVALGLGWLLRPWASAVALVGLMGWLGPALSAFAAERAAAMLGARRPWTLAAGLAYGLSGVAASAALEGHVPHLLEPWLPLVLAAGWRAGGADGRWWWGPLAGVGAALALLTTAYHGLAALLLWAVLLLRAAKEGGRAGVARLALAAVPLLPVGAWLAWSFVQGGAEVVPPRRMVELALLGSATPGALLWWTPAQDLLGHSVGAPTGGLVVGALLFGLLGAGGRREGDRWLLAIAALGLVLALGPRVPGLALLWETPAGAVLRFPVRFAWLTALAGGVLLARRMSQAAPRRAVVLLALALLDAFLVPGMPGRQQAQALPSAVAVGEQGEGAVLDLFPVAAWPAQADVEMRARTTACAGQVVHGRPTLARCIGTSVSDPRTVVAGWLLPRLMAPGGPPAGLGRRLAALGVGEVVMHEAAFRPEDLPVLRAALDQALGPEQQGRWRVAEPTRDRQEARRALASITRGPR